MFHYSALVLFYSERGIHERIFCQGFPKNSSSQLSFYILFLEPFPSGNCCLVLPRQVNFRTVNIVIKPALTYTWAISSLYALLAIPFVMLIPASRWSCSRPPADSNDCGLQLHLVAGIRGAQITTTGLVLSAPSP